MNTPRYTDPTSRSWLELGDLQRLLVDGWPGVVFGLDLDGRIRWLNPAARERLGREAGALQGEPLAGTLIGDDELARLAGEVSTERGAPVSADSGLLGIGLHGETEPREWVLRHHDGSPHPTRLTLGVLRDLQGQPHGLIAVEPSPNTADETRPTFSHHDPLTGLPTRAVFADRAEMALQRAARQKSVFAVAVVQLAGFADVCREHGDSVGDDLLRATAGRLHFELRKTDTATAFDRGAFAAMLVDLRHPDEARAVAEKIRKATSAPVNVGVAILPVATQVGVAWFPEHGDQLLPLLQAAESALTGAATKDTVAVPEGQA